MCWIRPPAAELPDIWYQVRKKVADIKQTLPTGVVGPFFNDEFGDVFGVIYGLTYDGFTERETRDFAEQARSAFLSQEDVAKVTIFGTQDEKFYLTISPKKLAALGLNVNQVLQAIADQNAVTPAGVISTSKEDILVQVTGALITADSLKQINLYLNKPLLSADRSRHDQEGLCRPAAEDVPGQRQARDRHRHLHARRRQYPANGRGAEEDRRRAPAALSDRHRRRSGLRPAEGRGGGDRRLHRGPGRSGRHRAGGELPQPGRCGPGWWWRSASRWCSPSSSSAWSMMGISLQRISLGALIIALGLLVDDAMITVEMMVSKIEEGYEKAKAATFAYTSVAFPMLTGTLVTIFGFLPIGFATQQRRAVLLLAVRGHPDRAAHLLVRGRRLLPGDRRFRAARQDQAEAGAQQEGHQSAGSFEALVVICMRFKYLTIAVTLALFGLSIYGVGLCAAAVLPGIRPAGAAGHHESCNKNASIFATEAKVDQVQKLLDGDPEVADYSVYIGGGAIRFYLPLDVQLDNNFLAQFVIVAKGLKERDAVKAKLDQRLCR